MGDYKCDGFPAKDIFAIGKTLQTMRFHKNDHMYYDHPKELRMKLMMMDRYYICHLFSSDIAFQPVTVTNLGS